MTYVFTKCGNLILGRIPTYVNESDKYVYPSFLVTQTSRAVEGVLHVHVIPLVKNEWSKSGAVEQYQFQWKIGIGANETQLQ